MGMLAELTAAIVAETEALIPALENDYVAHYWISDVAYATGNGSPARLPIFKSLINQCRAAGELKLSRADLVIDRAKRDASEIDDDISTYHFVTVTK
jgi:hypothetical protein